MKVRVTLRWDNVELGSKVVELDALDLQKWRTSQIRLAQHLELIHGRYALYESTLLLVTLEVVDDAGRRLPRRGA